MCDIDFGYIDQWRPCAAYDSRKWQISINNTMVASQGRDEVTPIHNTELAVIQQVLYDFHSVMIVLADHGSLFECRGWRQVPSFNTNRMPLNYHCV
jgi:hypothetical protein